MAKTGQPGPYPSVDRVARSAGVQPLVDSYGRQAVIDAIRLVLSDQRGGRGTGAAAPTDAQIASEVGTRLRARMAPRLQPVLNLTGTILHTNLGRALLCDAAIDHAAMAMRQPCNLEIDLSSSGRGERDMPIVELLTELTGAEDATVVNNNAAAVLLVVAALAAKRQVVLSRGELVEIGGSFRIPDVIRAANTRLIEVGTTNRTHESDYEAAIGPATAALMRVHRSNFELAGFTADVPEAQLARIAHAHGLPLFVDLGAGSLLDLATYGLPREPVIRDILAAGADVVTFSGDKLLGGPQAGLIVGRKQFIDRIRRHPLKRALRVSKVTLAALEATLVAYRAPDLLIERLPTLRLLARPLDQIDALARRLQPRVQAALGGEWRVTVRGTSSQAGSGSLPSKVIPSVALAICPLPARSGSAVQKLDKRFRGLPLPVLGRISNGCLWLDLRTLEDETLLLNQLSELRTQRRSRAEEVGVEPTGGA